MLFLLAYKNPKVVFKRLWLHFNLGPYWERMVQLWTFVRNPKRLWQWDVAHLPSVLGLFVAGEILFAAKKMVWTQVPLQHILLTLVGGRLRIITWKGFQMESTKRQIKIYWGSSLVIVFFFFFLPFFWDAVYLLQRP